MIVERASGEYTDFRIPGIVVTQRGTLLRYCECRKGQSDWAEIAIKISRSTDEGRSWTDVAFICEVGTTLNNPVMLVDGNRIVLLYCKNYRELRRRVSTDDGKSFGADERVELQGGIDFFYNVVAVGPGHGIRHRGRLIVPIWFAYNKENEKSHRPSFISTLYSEDHGASWAVGEIICRDRLVNPSECALAVDAADEVLISIRHEGPQRTRALAKSADGISGWHGLHFPERLPDPICMGSMTHRGGVIYHTNCSSRDGRVDLTLKISDDCFETLRQIPISDLAGYSDVAVANGKIFVFYEKTVVEDRKRLPFCLYFDVIDET